MIALLLALNIAFAHPPVPKVRPRDFLNEQGVAYIDNGAWVLIDLATSRSPINKMARQLKEKTGQDLIIVLDQELMGFPNAMVLTLHNRNTVQLIRLMQVGAPVSLDQLELTACQKTFNVEGD